MKIPALFCRLGLLLILSVELASFAAPETNPEPARLESTHPAEPVAASAPAAAAIPELDELRGQLRAMQRSNEQMQRSTQEAADKWAAMVQQNTALSNVLSGLEQTLVSQREREVELAKQSNSLYIRILSGAAVAVFLVFLFSYWFQLRCLNRVMELSRSVPTLPAHEPALLEQENPATSRLLAAMKLLEHRLEQLEVPGSAIVGASTNGSGFPENGPSHSTVLLNSAPPETSAPSNVSLLLAKGQVLLDSERPQEAVVCFQEAVNADPNSSEAHLKKGMALERLNRLELALSAYEEALRLNPRRTMANVCKARVLAALHRYDEALSVYDSALGRKSSNAETPIFVS